MSHLINIIKQNKKHQKGGIYSVCSANPLVLEAAILQAKKDNKAVLIESTSNQVNQFGGYTGMTPAEFREFVLEIATQLDFPERRVILGGDHLGPNCWQDEKVDSAMAKSRELIRAYVIAGFTKIHLDCSMGCADDSLPLSDEIIASRAADLCKVAEATAQKVFGSSQPLHYVIGTEVPVPGGESEALDTLRVTPPEAANYTLECHKKAFANAGLGNAWERVIGLVVQPGVEFDQSTVIPYLPRKARNLSQFIKNIPNIVFEAHSTDYQTIEAYRALVNDHFAILKVGPQLTFAMREAVYGLSHIEDSLIEESERSNIREVMDEAMTENPKHWEKYYQGTDEEQKLARIYSYSDRIRYYWAAAKPSVALNKLLSNLMKIAVPLPLISEFLPEGYLAIRRGEIKNNPKSLIHFQIMQVLNSYSKAC